MKPSELHRVPFLLDIAALVVVIVTAFHHLFIHIEGEPPWVVILAGLSFVYAIGYSSISYILYLSRKGGNR
jgi:hypothetical protein